MKNETKIVALVCLIVASLTLGCASAVDKVVDNKVSKMVAEENEKLPASVGHGIELNRITYDESSNQLHMKYSVPDQRKFNASLGRVKSETNKRVLNNGSLVRALDNGVRVIHDFYTSKDASGTPFKTFETKK